MATKSLRTRIVVRIWFIALLFNTAIGTTMMVRETNFDMVFLIVMLGSILGLVFSSPAPIILFVFLGECMEQRISPARMICVALLAAAICGLLAWLLFGAVCHAWNDFGWPYLLLAILSGVFATLTQRNNIRQLATYSESFEEFLS